MCHMKKKLKNESVAVGDKTSRKIILILFNSENTILSHHTVLAFSAFSPTKMLTDWKRISE